MGLHIGIHPSPQGREISAVVTGGDMKREKKRGEIKEKG
jgi:hypothetical protein